MDNPFVIEVYDGAFNRKGWVGDPESLTVTPRHNQQPTATLTVASDHRRLADLSAHGARVVILYRGALLMSGMVRLRQGQGPSSTGTVTYGIVDDFRLLTRVLGWQVPASAIDSQTASEYNTRTGPAETVAKGFVRDNAATRIGLPVTIATDQGRGSSVKVQMRMTPLADKLLPALDTAGVGVTVRQSGSRLVFDCYTPRAYPHILSELSGVVTEWSWSEADPEATRVVVGGQGDGIGRVFRSVTDAAREADFRDVIEVFRDATDVTTPTELVAAGQAALAEAAPTAGLALTLSETGMFRYDPTGVNGVRVGDKVRVEVGPGVIVEDVLRETTLSWTKDEGLVVAPVVGDRTDDPDKNLNRAIGFLARGYRILTAGR